MSGNFEREESPHPQRLIDTPGPAGDALRDCADDWTGELQDRRSFARLLAKMELSRRSDPLVGWAFALGAVLALVTFWAMRPKGTPQAAYEAPPAVEALAPAPELPLTSGPNALPDGTKITVASETSAKLRQTRAGARAVVLDRGRIDLAVAPQPSGQSFSVLVGGYEFSVIGTEFSVVRKTSGTTLDVREGTVAVRQDGKEIARVSGGGSWQENQESARPAPAESAEAPAPPTPKLLFPPRSNVVPEIGAQPVPPKAAAPVPTLATEPLTPPPAERDCLQLTRAGQSADALSCFSDQAEGTGLGAETALYELARLERDVFNRPARALAALERYRTRFPSGALRAEVDFFVVDLLARGGRAREALAETERILSSPAGAERGPELRILRGNLYRERLGDCGQAQAEYERVPHAGAAWGEALVGKAICAEQAGNREAARQWLEQCLTMPECPRKDRVRQRLHELRSAP